MDEDLLVAIKNDNVVRFSEIDIEYLSNFKRKLVVDLSKPDNLGECFLFVEENIPVICARYSSTNIIKWIFENYPDVLRDNKYSENDEVHSNILWYLSKGGDLDMIKWANNNLPELFDEYALACAADNGQLEVVKWLCENRKEDDMFEHLLDGAASNGHLEVLKWLHDNNIGEMSVNAFDDACYYGHYNVVEWLYTHRTEGYTDDAMSSAIRNNHTKIVNFLLKFTELRLYGIDYKRAYQNDNQELFCLLFRHLNDKYLVDSTLEDKIESVQNLLLECMNVMNMERYYLYLYVDDLYLNSIQKDKKEVILNKLQNIEKIIIESYTDYKLLLI